MIKQKKKVDDSFMDGFIAGQRKLCNAILGMTLENVADYQWLLTHLKEVSEGREVITNTASGFVKYSN